MKGKTQLEILKDIGEYIKSFDKSKYENEHLFGLWHGLKVAQAVVRGDDPSQIELPDWPEEWDYQKREDGELEDDTE